VNSDGMTVNATVNGAITNASVITIAGNDYDTACSRAVSCFPGMEYAVG